MTDNVISFRRHADTHATTEITELTREITFASANDSVAEAPAVAKFDDIYPDPAALEPQLLTARNLLDQYISLLNRADAELDAGRSVSSDELVMSAHFLMPELFCCRSVGEGFSALVLAMYHGVQNLRGEPLSLAQIQSLSDAANWLLREPYLTSDAAFDIIDAMEAAGLIPDPSRLGLLVDALGPEEHDE